VLRRLRALLTRRASPVPDCGGCPTDPAEYFHCLRWQAGDPACRPKKGP
jgi:hypothetical protein